MKCFTVYDFDAIEGIRISRAMRPYLAAGTTDKVMLGPDLMLQMRHCLEDPENWTGEDLRFDRVFWDVFLHRASLATDKQMRSWLTPETDDESKQRALVLFEADVNYTGVDLSSQNVHFGTYPSLEIAGKMLRILIDERRKTSKDAFDQAVRQLTRLAVMSPGDHIELSIAWYRLDGRRLWVRAERATRKVSSISWDGSALTVTDQTLWHSGDSEVIERL